MHFIFARVMHTSARNARSARKEYRFIAVFKRSFGVVRSSIGGAFWYIEGKNICDGRSIFECKFGRAILYSRKKLNLNTEPRRRRNDADVFDNCSVRKIRTPLQ